MNENDVIAKMTSQMRAKLYSLWWKSWFWCTFWALHVIFNTFTHHKQFNILHTQQTSINWSLRQISCCLSLAISVHFKENWVPYFEYPFPFHDYHNGKAFIETHGGGSPVMILARTCGYSSWHLTPSMNHQSVKHNNLYVVYIDRLWP